MTKITSHKELLVYQQSLEAAMTIFELTQRFPREELYSLTDQIRRSSRSVSANITEAWRKRRYEAAFIAKLNDAEGEAAETQTWLEYACRCGYASSDECQQIDQAYDRILRMLVHMIRNTDSWLLREHPQHD